MKKHTDTSKTIKHNRKNQPGGIPGQTLFKNGSTDTVDCEDCEYLLDKITYEPSGIRGFINAMIADHTNQLETVKPEDFRKPSRIIAFKNDLRQEILNLKVILETGFDQPFLIVEFKEVNSRNSFCATLDGKTHFSLFYMEGCRLSMKNGALTNEVAVEDAKKNVFIVNGKNIQSVFRPGNRIST